MDIAAVEHARVRLLRAKIAHKALLDAPRLPEMELAWSDFLLAASGVYSKLEQGSKKSPQSREWFGRKKRVRKDDSLLRYLHHARNSDEHGIEAITAADPGGIGINAATVGQPVSFSLNPDGYPRKTGELIIVNDDPSSPLIVSEIAPSIRLIAVRDSRYGDTFDIPSQHLGATLKDVSPAAVAELAIQYLASLIAEAENLK